MRIVIIQEFCCALTLSREDMGDMFKPSFLFSLIYEPTNQKATLVANYAFLVCTNDSGQLPTPRLSMLSSRQSEIETLSSVETELR